VQHVSCAEAAVVGIPDEVRGQAIFAYCTLKHGFEESPELIQELKQEVRKHIGGFALPQAIVFATALPKTRSGKIMRRILRKIASGDISSLGDITTLVLCSIYDLVFMFIDRLILIVWLCSLKRLKLQP
jgi:acetyl-CoA synthetase